MSPSTNRHDDVDGDEAVAAAAATAAKSAIDFLTVARGLKTTARTGWIRQEASAHHPHPRVESVADHSWRIALMALVASSSTSGTIGSQIDTNKCLKMALVHDLAEARVGDITPHCGVSDQDKHQQELLAITEMTKLLEGHGEEQQQAENPFALVGSEILALWKEYEEGTTMEANLVKDMDKLEMTLQALEYEQDGNNQKSLDGFFDSTRKKWRTAIGEAWGREIESRRPKNKS